MKHQAIRRAALMLSVLLATVVRTQAGTITLADVAHAYIDGQQMRPGVELRLRSVAQSGSVPIAGVPVARLVQSGNQSSTQTGTQTGTQSTTSTSTTGSGTIVDAAQTQQQPGGGTVETVDLGDVTGTVCDCGEIPVPPVHGKFPLWPLLALAGIPLAFLPDNEETPIEFPPTPPPPPPAIPEPATILLFGSSLMALGAGARRRSRKAAAVEAANKAEEV